MISQMTEFFVPKTWGGLHHEWFISMDFDKYSESHDTNQTTLLSSIDECSFSLFQQIYIGEFVIQADLIAVVFIVTILSAFSC